jgi:ATP-dependent Clp protease ATP-binding subunit ClpA
MTEKVMGELRGRLRPEFLNRIDEIIVFHALDRRHMGQIVRLLIKHVADRLEEHEIVLEVSDDAIEFLARVGYDPAYGARPLKRAIQTYLENPLAKRIIAGEISEGSKVKVDASDLAKNPDIDRPFTAETALAFEATQGAEV